jgi:ribA/ribD-fused uncharacterized protein
MPHLALEILNSTDALDCMYLGKNVLCNELWEGLKGDYMRGILRAKYTKNINLRDALLGTEGREIVEDTGNEYWGRGNNGRGKNALGKILMDLRDD